nr:hypothetical protein [Bordetella holmesii]
MVSHSSYSVAVRTGVDAAIREKLAAAVRQAVASEAMNKARQDLFLESYEGSLDDYKRELLELAREFEASARKQDRTPP